MRPPAGVRSRVTSTTVASRWTTPRLNAPCAPLLQVARTTFSLARTPVASVLLLFTRCSVRRSSTDSTRNSTCACARTHRQPSSEPAPGTPALEPRRPPSGSSRSSLSVHQANTWTLNSPSEISIAPSQASSRRYISDAYGQQRRCGSGVGSSRSWN
jgi:hypothetical protein